MPEQSIKERRHKTTQAVELSRDMLVLAQKEDWEQLAQVERERDRLLQEGLKETVPADMEAFAIQAIKEIQQWDEQVSALVEATKMRTLKELDNLNRSKKASELYKENDPQK